jgi:hypothetical protein
VRAIVAANRNQMQLVSRNGNDITGSYPELTSEPLPTWRSSWSAGARCGVTSNG